MTCRGFYGSELLVQNFVVLNVFFLFMNQAQFLNSFGFFVTLCSINGLKATTAVKTINFQILCYIKSLETPFGH